MGDLISRSALIKAMKNKYEVADKTGLNAVGLDCGFIITEKIIDEQPSVDAVPVVHGNWDKYRLSKLFKLTCSVCHADVDEKTPFCPWCGAKMDGKKVQE